MEATANDFYPEPGKEDCVRFYPWLEIPDETWSLLLVSAANDCQHMLKQWRERSEKPKLTAPEENFYLRAVYAQTAALRAQGVPSGLYQDGVREEVPAEWPTAEAYFAEAKTLLARITGPRESFTVLREEEKSHAGDTKTD